MAVSILQSHCSFNDTCPSEIPAHHSGLFGTAFLFKSASGDQASFLCIGLTFVSTEPPSLFLLFTCLSFHAIGTLMPAGIVLLTCQPGHSSPHCWISPCSLWRRPAAICGKHLWSWGGASTHTRFSSPLLPLRLPDRTCSAGFQLLRFFTHWKRLRSLFCNSSGFLSLSILYHRV